MSQQVDRVRGFDHSEKDILDAIERVREVFNSKPFKLARVKHPDIEGLLCFRMEQQDDSLQITETYFSEDDAIVPAGWRISVWSVNEDGEWKERTLQRVHTLNNLALDFMLTYQSVLARQAGFEAECECLECRIERGDPVAKLERDAARLRKTVGEGIKSILLGCEN